MNQLNLINMKEENIFLSFKLSSHSLNICSLPESFIFSLIWKYAQEDSGLKADSHNLLIGALGEGSAACLSHWGP